jgi:hypothetical protein
LRRLWVWIQFAKYGIFSKIIKSFFYAYILHLKQIYTFWKLLGNYGLNLFQVNWYVWLFFLSNAFVSIRSKLVGKFLQTDQDVVWLHFLTWICYYGNNHKQLKQTRFIRKQINCCLFGANETNKEPWFNYPRKYDIWFPLLKIDFLLSKQFRISALCSWCVKSRPILIKRSKKNIIGFNFIN